MSRGRAAERGAVEGVEGQIGRILASLRAFLAELGPPPEDVRSILVVGRAGPRGPEFTFASRPALVAHLRRAGEEETAQALDAPVPAGGVRVVAVAPDGTFSTAVARWPELSQPVNACGGMA
ncbi:hypothetical protein ACSRUE_01510 [Sorangium sp. KYC3313]|uniref:hypothetical protein n=1 Tax=Sorangium sp. KYC3313 TaxID=3449740 RepID=UPI003F8C2E71